MLKLQKIEMVGFKSFADLTEVSFQEGNCIAGIVGPNGCGKSNISDAIHWVLGEQSAKSLRSGRMQDVIFNGTPSRKATGMAEVRLTMRDLEVAETLAASSVVAIPKNGGNGNHPAVTGEKPAAITVARRLFHSGESEYLMNGRPCRLRDIQEIFLGTGLGPDCYAIIEQGRIGQILSAKPYERRALIEEAAGVTKFKARRKLAWAKLEASKQNLARVNDILEEIRRQVNSLQRQAARARRYTGLRDEMRAQLRVVLGTRFREREQEAVQAALELGLLQRSLQERAALAEERERERQALDQQLQQEEVAQRRAVEERSLLRLAAERARHQAASQSQQIAYLERRVAEAQDEEAQLGSRIERLEGERTAGTAILDEVWSEMEALAEQLRDRENQSRACQSDLKERERRLDPLRQEMLETVDQCATLRNQATQLEQFAETTRRQSEQAVSQRVAAEAAREAAASRQQQIQTGLARKREELESLAGRRQAGEEELRAHRQEESRQRDRLEELRATLSAQRARKASLEEVLSHRAYSTEAVQRLFQQQAARKSGSGQGHWRGSGQPDAGEGAAPRFEPIGVLADFIEVEPAYEHVIEEFLREELDYIVVEDWAEASEGLRLLRSEAPGRATFLLHSAASRNGHSEAAAESLAARAGIVHSLESCLRFTNGLSATAGTLLPKLRRSYLVQDAEAGRALAEEHPEFYFLTPQGEWFQGSTVTAGKADHSGPLALKRELRELTRAVREQEETAARTRESLSRVAEEIARQEAALQALAQEQQEAEKATLVTERDLREAAEEVERALERAALLGLEVERLRREEERARDRWSQDAQEIAAREQRRTEMEAEITATVRAISDLEAAREAALARAGEIRSRLAALEERHRAGVAALEQVQRNLEEFCSRQAALLQQVEEWQAQKDRYAADNQRLDQEAAAADRRSEALSAEMEEREKCCQRLRARVAEIEQELQQRRQELNELRDRKTTFEVQMARLESELAHLKESCRSELQVEIEALGGEELPPLNAEELAAAEDHYRQLRTRIENLGPINMMALEEYDEAKQRHDFLETQRQDLLDSIRDTTRAIEEIDAITRQQFAEAFEAINAHFQETFERLFGGGQGLLRLTEAEDSSEAGVEIVAQPPGKRLQNVLLLSGGEKALTALALLLAIFRYKPSPFCVLDEVDAPLDDANIGRFTRMVEEMSRDTQFILITHSKKTMNIASVLYGVTMQEPGISKILSVKFNGAGNGARAAAEQVEAVA